MPCNAVLQQTGQLTLAPQLLLQQPAFLQFLAARLAATLGDPVALCTPTHWHTTYLNNLEQQPLTQFDFAAQGALFFAQGFSIALHLDGRIELRDGMRIGQRPANAEQILAQLTAMINAAAGVALQQAVTQQLAQLGTLTARTQQPNGALTLSLTV